MSSIQMPGGAGRRPWKWIRPGAIFLWMLMGAAAAHGQVVRYDNIALGPHGQPVSGATVAVCAATADTTTEPCSPLVQLYSDEGMTQPQANPFSADTLGNYGFWAAPGHYVVQIYGTGLHEKRMDVFLPCDPSNCTMSSATFSSITANTLNLSGNLTVNGRGVATKPLATDAVQYVSPNGSDTNDGLSWGTAKQDIQAAWNALYANSSPGGTIFVAAGAACGPSGANHLWVMSANDPNWSSGPAAGWVASSLSPMRIVGVGTNKWTGGGGYAPVVNLSCGSATDPPLWISGTQVPIEFDNLEFSGGTQAARLGIDSNNSATDTSTGVAGLTFKNVNFSPDTSAGGNGPSVEIGPNSFWLYFERCHISANSNAGRTLGSDAASAMVINIGGTGVSSSGTIFLRDTNTIDGPVKYYCGTTACQLTVDGLTSEGQSSGHGAVWIVNARDTSSFNIQNVFVADATVTTPAVEVDSGPGEATVVANVFGYVVNTQGPMTVLGASYPNNWKDVTDLPSVSGQYGFEYGHVWGQVDAARRLFPLNTYPWSNLANENPSGWTVTNYGTVGTTSSTVKGPDGASYALTASSPSDSGGTQTVYLYPAHNLTVSTGDYFVGGAWYRSNSGVAPVGGNALSFGTGGCTFTELDGGSSNGSFGHAIKGDGEWEWFSHAWKVTAGGTCSVSLTANFNLSTPISVSGPVLMQIPSADATTNEVGEVAANLASFPNGVPSLTNATLPGHSLSFGGSGDGFFATLDHTALTADRTFDMPDGAGTLTYTTASSPTSGDCVQWGANFSLTDTGSACGSGGGGAGTGTANTWTATQTFNPGTDVQAVIIKPGVASPTANLLEVQTNGGTVHGGFNFEGDVLTYKQVSAASSQNLSLNPGCSACQVILGGNNLVMHNTSSHLNISSGGNGDLDGQIAISSATSGSKTFGTAYSSAPVCVASPTSDPGTTTWWVTTTTTAVTVNLSASGTITFNYICMGNPN